MTREAKPSGLMASIDEMMYSCGVEVLHPGGLEKTRQMADDCKIGPRSKVLDIGCGKGNTAIFLAKEYGCGVVGVDLSKDMVEYAEEAARRAGLSDKISFQSCDAQRLPFPDASFDIVFAECSTVLMDKAKSFGEFLRVVKPCGRVGDLEMSWKKTPSERIAGRAFELWEGFETMTFDEWRAFFESVGMIDVKVDDFSDTLNDMGKNYMKWLGIKGIAKILWRTLRDRALMRGMIEYERFFKEGKDFIGYGYFVGRKPETA